MRVVYILSLAVISSARLNISVKDDPSNNPCLRQSLVSCQQDSGCLAVSFMPGGPGTYSTYCKDKVTGYGRVGSCFVKDGSGNMNENPGFCRCIAMKPVPASWPTSCGPTPVSNCTPAQLALPRISQAWEPTGVAGSVEETVAALRVHRPAYTDYSVTWAFWNDGKSSRCGKSDNPPGSGLCYRSYSSDAAQTVAAARLLGYRIVPILEVCCECVLTGGYDYITPMQGLVNDLKANNFSGYSLDMVCGGGELAKLRGPFLSTFTKMIKQVNPSATVSFWSHAKYAPELSFPMDAAYVFDMDTYYYTGQSFVEQWFSLFQCQAGIGLQWPYAVSASAMTATIDYMITLPHLRAAGTWGLLPYNSTDSARLQAVHDGLKAWLAAGS